MSDDLHAMTARFLFVLPLCLAGCGSANDGGLFESSSASRADAGREPTGGRGGTSGGGSCSPLGTWATFVEVGVDWSSATIQPGSGTTRQWIISTRREENGQYVDFARACGIGAFNVPLGSPWFRIRDLPELNIFDEWTGVEFSEATFDSGALPTVELPTTFVHQGGPGVLSVGDTFAIEAKPFLYGAEGLMLGDEWPAIQDMIPLLQDHDQDGRPGMTGMPFQGPVPGEPEGVVFTYPRVDVGDPVTRASELHMVVRTQAAIEGEIVSCGDPLRAEGRVVPGSLRIDSRIVACTVASTGGPCTDVHVNFIDANLPVFEPNGTSVVASIKVDDDTTCAEVRDMDFGLKK